MEMKLQRRRKTLERYLDKVNDGDGNETTEENEDIREDGWTK